MLQDLPFGPCISKNQISNETEIRRVPRKSVSIPINQE